MKKLIHFFTLTLITLCVPCIALAGMSRSQSFRVSVTLPAIVGQNVFPESQQIGLTDSKLKQDIIREETQVDNQQVVLQTIVLK